MQRRVVFPFSAIVALDKLKLAILINAINPKIGGLLIRGPKGSGKTTVVRGLIDVLPRIDVVEGCPFSCSPNDPSNMCPKCSEHYLKDEKLPVKEREMTIVNLPLGATEDRVVGSLNVEKAIKLGVEALQPGILAEANQNILYVDEINLLPDHIADDLLDAAATGWNVVEREGISINHPSHFIFIGTMNPEEGELRPQLLDRFPLSIGVEKISSVKDRMKIVRRNVEFESDPEKFREKYLTTQEELKNRIIQARNILPKVQMPEKLLEAVCKTCLDLKVDGVRPDIVISKAACTLAAFERRTEVTPDDIIVASELALSHRTRQGGFLDPAPPKEIKKILNTSIKETGYKEKTKATEKDEEAKNDKEAKGRAILWYKEKKDSKKEKIPWGHERLHGLMSKISQVFATLNRVLGIMTFGRVHRAAKKLKKAIKRAPSVKGVLRGATITSGESPEKEGVSLGRDEGIPSVDRASESPEVDKGFSVLTKIKGSVLAPFKLFFSVEKTLTRKRSSYAGKRAETVTTLHRGRPFGWRLPHDKPSDIHLPATIRVAARRQRNREKPFETALKICLEDVREKVRLYKAPMTIVLVIDLSGSMVLSIEAVKKALLKLHRDAYRYRDRVGIVALKETGAVVVQHPITNLLVVAKRLLELRISGGTPLATGMLKALEVLKDAQRRDSSTIPVMVIITDGSANVPLSRSLETSEIRKFDEVSIATRQYEDLAVRDVWSVSKMIRKEGVYTIVVNTNPRFIGRETYGFAVTELIASITKGRLHVVGRVAHNEELVRSIVNQIAEDQRLIAHEASLSLKFA
ncbi:MAG: VWA domain-containing protein [Candidatus Bathyarchaeota archaeon]|nr:MAG: VWA domain-containing protein [Candidatus Bathyarchaeota archaeon]